MTKMGQRSSQLLTLVMPVLQKATLRACPSANEYKNSISPKACSRCGGLFNREWPLRDIGGGKEFFHSGVLLYSLRCTSCGEVVDPIILKNRALQALNGVVIQTNNRTRSSKKQKSPICVLLKEKT
ncbi:MAG: hypothetical protein AAB362_02125 [Patescibacteria group bacterium]